MERSLFAFIWKYSKRQQLLLLGFTVLSFPLLYATLELPKRIINDAIGSETALIEVWNYDLTQIEYLMLLCFGFLAAVLASGLMKMRLNTMKGVLAERLLRRFRYQLLNRMMRFPRSYFRTTSQGELVAMVTSEAEPMGGLMGDAVAQPVFQAGQMLTIVTFLFLQSPWFGLAAVALIPLQAWLIPMLQRQINLLNKKRIIQVRGLASEIGESAAGISDLRTNGGWRYRLSVFTARLGRLFQIRFQIYQKKFFMKFLNNFITQLTPFFFYSVGGYLAIRGEITVGALVAALAAYKDLSSPWKELLTYYNQVQDMSLRWQIVTERFDPKGMVDEALFDSEPGDIPQLRGDIRLDNVTVRDEDGNTVLDGITLDIPHGARVAIQVKNQSDRTAFADLLTRELVPSRGSVTMAGHSLNDLHQAVIAARIGYAHSRPYLFDGTLGDNLLMSLKTKPQSVPWDPKGQDREALEARRSGNSTDKLDADWVDPALAGLNTGDDIRDWWFKLVEAMGIDEMMFRRTMKSRLDPATNPELVKRVIDLRDEVAEALRAADLDHLVYRFDPETFNPAIPLGGNLLFAAPSRDISQEGLAAETAFINILRENDVDHAALTISEAVVTSMVQTFGREATDHPLFRQLGIEDELYFKLADIAEKRKDKGDAALTAEERALLMTVPFAFTAEQIGPAFPEAFKTKILQLRKTKARELLAGAGDLFVPVAPDAYLNRLTVLENLIYGRVSMMAGADADRIEDIVAEILERHGLRRQVASIMYDLPTGLGGAKLPTVLQERAAFSRAGIKRPDILILDKVLASHSADSRRRTRDRLRHLLPDSTLIFMEDSFQNPDEYDLFLELKNGRIDGITRPQDATGDDAEADDLQRKLRIISQTELFANLDRRNQRLLAFSANWYSAAPGQVIFAEGATADAVYLCLKGLAELRWHDPDPQSDQPLPDEGRVSEVTPGRVIGDLSVVLNEPRQLELVSVTETLFLRISAEEFMAVVETDPHVALSILRTVSGYLVGAATLLRSAHVPIPQDMGSPEPGSVATSPLVSRETTDG